MCQSAGAEASTALSGRKAPEMSMWCRSDWRCGVVLIWSGSSAAVVVRKLSVSIHGRSRPRCEPLGQMSEAGGRRTAGANCSGVRSQVELCGSGKRSLAKSNLVDWGKLSSSNQSWSDGDSPARPGGMVCSPVSDEARLGVTRESERVCGWVWQLVSEQGQCH